MSPLLAVAVEQSNAQNLWNLFLWIVLIGSLAWSLTWARRVNAEGRRWRARVEGKLDRLLDAQGIKSDAGDSPRNA